jgi:two-component system, OmpR family, response regulator RegX3
VTISPTIVADSQQLTVLVIEDEESFVEALTVGLEREGFRVAVANDGASALQRFGEVAPDIVLLDLMLPRVSGIDVCRQLRRVSQVPIIMVTAKSSEIDTVVGLEVGADDYVAKPYRIRELVARMHAVMRRRQVAASAVAADDGQRAGTGSSAPEARPLSDDIRIGGLTLDPVAHRVLVDDAEVVMPLKEFMLLHLLMSNAGRVLTREVLIDRVWGHDYYGDTKTLDVHIKRLRSKIEADPANPKRIVTIRGLGYKFDRPRV